MGVSIYMLRPSCIIYISIFLAYKIVGTDSLLVGNHPIQVIGLLLFSFLFIPLVATYFQYHSFFYLNFNISIMYFQFVLYLYLMASVAQ